MDTAYLARQLMHRVDVQQWLGTDEWGQNQTQYYRRIPCLVDQSSGKRVVAHGHGETLTYDFAITFSALPFDLRTGVLLEDARDQDGSQIFDRARIGQLRIYRKSRGGGVHSYLAMASSVEAGT